MKVRPLNWVLIVTIVTNGNREETEDNALGCLSQIIFARLRETSMGPLDSVLLKCNVQ